MRLGIPLVPDWGQGRHQVLRGPVVRLWADIETHPSLTSAESALAFVRRLVRLSGIRSSLGMPDNGLSLTAAEE